MRNRLPVASGLSISESQLQSEGEVAGLANHRGRLNLWERQPIIRAVASDSPGPRFPPFR